MALTDLAYPDQTAHGRIVDISQSGIRVRMSLRVDPGSTVKLEIANCTLFGHAIHCREYAGAQEIGIELVRVLVGAPDLGQMLRALLAESSPHANAVTVGAGAPDRVAVHAWDMGEC